jgi:hypothetical protein
VRRLVAAFVVGITLVGAIYMSSLNLGGPTVRCIRELVPSTGLGGRPNLCRSGTPILFLQSQAGWQIPVSILIGVLGMAGGLVVLRTRPKQPVGNSAQPA